MRDSTSVGVAVQLYTLRELLDRDVEGTLDALAQAGAREVELAGLHDRSGPAMRAALDAAGLVAVSAHVPLERFEQEPGAVLEEAAALGASTLVVPWVRPPASAAEADAVVARIAAAAAVTAGAGLGFAYHNHDFEFRALDDGTNLWSRITGAGWDLEPDVGWLRVAGHDAVAVLEELQGRCPLVHAKDVRRTPSGEWEDVPAGDGELDWTAVGAAARAAGTAWLIVELDNPAPDTVSDVARSLDTLRAALAA
jgi:sugar phosphate isomerase/epimerase